MHACMYVCMYMYVSMMHACMHACMHVSRTIEQKSRQPKIYIFLKYLLVTVTGSSTRKYIKCFQINIVCLPVCMYGHVHVHVHLYVSLVCCQPGVMIECLYTCVSVCMWSMFLIFMDDFITIMREKCINENIIGSLHILLHADDIVVLSTCRNQFIYKCNT